VRAAVDAAVGVAVDDAVRSKVGDAVGAAVGGAVGDAVGAEVGGAVDAAVGDAVGVAVGAAVREAVGHAVYDAVRSKVGDAVRDAVGDAGQLWMHLWHRYIGGQFWVGGWYWGGPSWVSFFLDVCGLEVSAQTRLSAEAYAGCADSACWWWPHRDFVMVSERPLEIHLDVRGRLHSENGPSISWPDGWSLYHVHGVAMPADAILDRRSITVSRIEAEPNAEVRRVLIELYGRDRYVADAQFVVLDTRMDEGCASRTPRVQRLLEKCWPDGRRLCLIETVNSSPEPDGSFRVYYLGVHPECRPLRAGGVGDPQPRTALNAIASLAGMTGAEYLLAVQT
jgi:hypothetical protein